MISLTLICGLMMFMPHSGRQLINDLSQRDLYLSVLQEMDNQLGKLFNYIRNSPELKDNTLIMVCQDSLDPEKEQIVAGPFRG